LYRDWDQTKGRGPVELAQGIAQKTVMGRVGLIYYDLGKPGIDGAYINK